MKYNYFHHKNDSLRKQHIQKFSWHTSFLPQWNRLSLQQSLYFWLKININFPTLKTLIKLQKSKKFLRKIDRLIDIQTDTQTLSIHIPNIYWYDMITYNISIISSWKKKRIKIPTPHWKIISTMPIYIKHCKS